MKIFAVPCALCFLQLFLCLAVATLMVHCRGQNGTTITMVTITITSPAAVSLYKDTYHDYDFYSSCYYYIPLLVFLFDWYLYAITNSY